MPKFLTGCHYNEEEISWHLEKNIGYWPVQVNGNKFATGQILEKLVEVVKGRILAGWAQKSPAPCLPSFHPPIAERARHLARAEYNIKVVVISMEGAWRTAGGLSGATSYPTNGRRACHDGESAVLMLFPFTLAQWRAGIPSGLGIQQTTWQHLSCLSWATRNMRGLQRPRVIGTARHVPPNPARGPTKRPAWKNRGYWLPSMAFNGTGRTSCCLLLHMNRWNCVRGIPSWSSRLPGRKITRRFRRIYRLYLRSLEKKPKDVNIV